MAITTQMRADVSGLYVALFGRAPDGEGLGYWVQQLDQGKTLVEVADAMYGTAPARAYFPSFMTNGEIIDSFYVNVLGRAPDAEGLAYWTGKLNGPGATPGSVIAEIIDVVANYNGTDPAGLKSAALFQNKVQVAQWYGEQNGNIAGATSILSGVTEDPATVAQAMTGSGQTFTLTEGVDVASAGVFNAPRDYTPGGTDQVNSLNDDDVLTGTGADATLNFDYVNDADTADYDIQPTLNNVRTVNVKFATDGDFFGVASLDLQDADAAVEVVNVSRIDDDLTIASVNNLIAPITTLSVTDSNAPATQVELLYTAAGVVAANDALAVTLDNVNVANLRIESDANGAAGGAAITGAGVETITMDSTGAANSLSQLTAEDLETLVVTGDKALSIVGTVNTNRAGTNTVEAVQYTAGLANVAGSFSRLDASAMTGALTIGLGTEIAATQDNTSGVAVQASIQGGKGNDTFILTAGANVGGAATNTDIIDGNEGTNTMVIVGGATVAAAATANVRDVQALEIRTGHDIDVAADVVNIDADAFDSLATIFVRNEGVDGGATNTSSAEGMTVNLTDLTAAQATGITVAHGTTGNSTIANNVVNVAFKTAGTANATQVTIVDGINNDPVYNLNLTAASSELVTLVDSDTESNTVHLNQGVFTQAGSTITLQGGAAGQYMNLDSFSGAAVAAGVTDGYGYATTGVIGSQTTVAAAAAAIAGVPTTVSTSLRDNSVATALTGNGVLGGAPATRHVVENIAAASYVGDVIVRLGDVTRADGVTSMNIATGTGNDTLIFDALGVTNAGFTSGDTVAAGAGTDTLVLDGNTATIPGTPRIDHQASEWDNVTGVDVLRFAQNEGVVNVGNAAQVAAAGGAYYARIDNEFIDQTDAGNRLTVVNNDGWLNRNSESDLVLDLRGINQSNFVTFVGADGVGGAAAISSNRLVVDDVTSNQNMILDGGDTDVRASSTVGYVAGNNNVYEVRNTANTSINDLAQTSNFGLINFTNDQAVAQTLTLTLNSTVVEALVDQSNTATTAATQEILRVVATDNGVVASALNVDARQVTGFHSLVVTGSNIVTTGNDVLTMNSNVGGSVNYINLGAASLGDRVNWTGGSATTTVNIDMGNNAVSAVGAVVTTVAGDGFAQFVDGAVTTTHDVNNAEIVDLSSLTYATSVINGTAAAETIIGGAGVDVITGGAGADVFTIATGGTGITVATADTITDFISGTDTINAATVTAYTEANGALSLNFGVFLTRAGIAFTPGAVEAYVEYNMAGTGDGYLLIDENASGAVDLGDTLVILAGVNAANEIAATDLV